ncbi:hypothetical protein BSBH6_04095 [Bacillus subtilis]|nr:hypothetical protein BSBH6_04095 [Bacillus subtilis]RPK20304.1 hypothetical protein BH5_04096 [Bacillus subtilis]
MYKLSLRAKRCPQNGLKQKRQQLATSHLEHKRGQKILKQWISVSF